MAASLVKLGLNIGHTEARPAIDMLRSLRTACVTALCVETPVRETTFEQDGGADKNHASTLRHFDGIHSGIPCWKHWLRCGVLAFRVGLWECPGSNYS